ncbi:MAG: GntR family transcriptional regulator [Ilumatobacteraceae bacterium]
MTTAPETAQAYGAFRARRDEATPLHEQVSSYLRAQILVGTLAARTKLPAEPDLAVLLDVSRGTIRRAMASLMAEGLIVQRHGRGTFVAATPDVEAPFVQEITSLAQSLSTRGRPTTTRIRLLDQRPATPREAAGLGIEAGTTVHHLDRVRSDADGPAMRLVNVMRTDVVPMLDTDSLEREGLYDVFGQLGLAPVRAVRTFGATVADDELSALLAVPVGHPILHIEQTSTLPDGRVVEFSDVWLRGDRMRFQVEVRRTDPA